MEIKEKEGPILSKDLPKRMSVSLKEEDSGKLEELQEGLGVSKSKIFRQSLDMLYKLDVREADLSTLFDYLYLLRDRRHVALNREMMGAIMEELDVEEGDITEKFYEIGKFYWREYEEMDKESLDDVLKHLENHNWFRAIKKGEGRFTLEMRVKKSCELFKSFLRGVFENSPHEVNLEEIRRKILLRTVD